MKDKPDAASLKGRSQRISWRPGRLIEDFLVLATGQVAAKVLGFVAFAWLARVLTPAEYGTVETAVGMAAIGAIAVEIGTGTVGVRRLAQGEGSASSVLGDVISARMLVAIFVVPCLALAYIAATRGHRADALICLFAASLFTLPFNHNWFFQANDRMTIAAAGQTIKMGVFLAVLWLFQRQTNGLVLVGGAELIASALVAVWYSVLAFRTIQPSRPHYNLSSGLSLVRESAPLGASSLVNSVGTFLPVLIVAALHNNIEAADFGASQRLVVSLLTFSFVYYFNFYPVLARQVMGDVRELRDLVASSVTVTSWIGAFAALVLWVLAEPIMGLVFGPNFAAAGQDFAILVWSGPFVLASGNARWLLVANHRQNALLLAQIVSAGVTICACLILVPYFGSAGASASVVAGSIAIWISAHALTAGLDVRPKVSDAAPAAITCAALCLGLLVWKPDPWTGAGVASALMAFGLVIDRMFFRSLRTLARAREPQGLAE